MTQAKPPYADLTIETRCEALARMQGWRLHNVGPDYACVSRWIPPEIERPQFHDGHIHPPQPFAVPADHHALRMFAWGEEIDIETSRRLVVAKYDPRRSEATATAFPATGSPIDIDAAVCEAIGRLEGLWA